MVSFHLAYDGRLRCTAAHDPSGTEFITDAPADNHGLAQSFSPTDLVATALAACMITTVGMYADPRGIPLDGMKAYAEKHMSTDPPRRIARIVVKLTFPAGLDAEQRVILERVAANCPVERSLHPDIALDLSFEYPD